MKDVALEARVVELDFFPNKSIYERHFVVWNRLQMTWSIDAAHAEVDWNGHKCDRWKSFRSIDEEID